MTEQTVRDVLIAARKRIEREDAWGKGIRGPRRMQPLNTCCAAEAIEDVTSDVWGLRTAAYKALYQVIAAPSICIWNDAPERTHAEVLAAFDRAIAQA